MSLKIIFSLLVFTMVFISCTNEGIITNTFTDLDAGSWDEKDTLSFDFEIKDKNVQYNVFLNLRITNDYKYSNIYLQSFMGTNFEKPIFKRKHLLLATPDGQWLGKGNGEIITLQIPLYSEVEFKEETGYRVIFSQEMRDKLLESVISAGIMVKKGNPVF